MLGGWSSLQWTPESQIMWNSTQHSLHPWTKDVCVLHHLPLFQYSFKATCLIVHRSLFSCNQELTWQDRSQKVRRSIKVYLTEFRLYSCAIVFYVFCEDRVKLWQLLFLLCLFSWKQAQSEEYLWGLYSDFSSPSHLQEDSSWHKLRSSGRRNTREKDWGINTKQNGTEGYEKVISSEDIVEVTSIESCI